ncbi:DNA replication complex GINS protein SLD5, partial [Linum perenne]
SVDVSYRYWHSTRVKRDNYLLLLGIRVDLEQLWMQIEKYIFHIVKTDEYFSRLSKLEQAFAKRCTDDMGAHLKETVLSKLPDNYQSELKQSTTSEEDDMGK